MLCERVAAEGYVDAEGDAAAVSGLAEELRDILLEYWVSVNPRKLLRQFGRSNMFPG